MNLKDGIIELLGTSFGKNSTTEEALNNKSLTAFVDDESPIDLFKAENVDIAGIKFNADIYFLSKKINRIHLVPTDLEMADPGYPDHEYQDLKKKTCDAFLLKELGEPTQKNAAVTLYEFDFGTLASVAFYSGRNENAGGFIDISYKSEG